MTPVRVLIVGAGVMGRRHADAVRALGDVVVAVVDPDRTRAADLADPVDATAYASLEDALTAGGLDAAVVATPSPRHLAQATELARQSVDVLVEKPHRIPGERSDELRSALATGGGRLVVGMTTRHWPGIRAAAAAVAGGELGDLLSYDDRIHFRLSPGDLPAWYFDPAVSGGGVLLTNGVHAVDRARSILRGDLELEQARLSRTFPGHAVEDSAELRLRAGQVPVSISLLWAPYDSSFAGLRILGSSGSASIAPDGAWRIRSAEGERSGPALGESEALVLQWAAFRRGDAGFGLDDLEPTLELIEAAYRGVGR